MLDPALLAPERVRPLKRREYEQLVDLGVFEDERVELLCGQLVEMSPQGAPHSGISAWIAQRFIKALDLARYDIRSHSPFAASSDSMPEPDVSVSLRREDLEHPSSREVLLLIEVAESSVAKDRMIKTEIYAAAGVPEYWIVNVKRRVVEVLRGPTKSGYTRVTIKRIGDRLRSLRLRGITFGVGDIPWPREDEEVSKKKRKKKSGRRT